MTKKWSDVNALYQIYPLSFMDSDGSGTGDLRGIITKLDYLAYELGVDAVWISPFYPSPKTDCGYDVSNYCDVDPLFGTLDDFRELMRGAHDRDVKVMIDLVPNHTSDQHEWFIESRLSKSSARRDYYVWRDPAPGGGEPNNWLSMSGGSSWEYDPMSGQYYLHSFMKNQPDLNWDNPVVRGEVYSIMKFWLDMGVDGFRVDAVWPLSKDPELRDDPKNPIFEGPEGHYGNFVHSSCKCGPNLHNYLQEMSDVAAAYEDRFMVFEYYPDHMLGDINKQYHDLMRLNPRTATLFYFEGLNQQFIASSFRDSLMSFYAGVPEGATAAVCFGNHDQSRLATRFGSEQARLIAVLQMSLPGMPALYYGEELGMQNVTIDPSEYHDNFSSLGGMSGRDPQRTPMRWDSSRYAGFSTGQPWLPIGSEPGGHSADDERVDPNSFYALYQKLLALRREHAALRSGHVEFSDENNNNVLSYSVCQGTEQYRVALNFSDQEAIVHLPAWCTMLCSTRPADMPSINDDSNVSLGAFGAIIVKLPS